MVAHWGAGLEPSEHFFSSDSSPLSLTKQTVVSLKPTITTNSQQMFLLYSGVKTLHQKQSLFFPTEVTAWVSTFKYKPPSPAPSLSFSMSGELLGWGVVKTAVWVITAVITTFFLTLQTDAMWKSLIHGSQVLHSTGRTCHSSCGLWPPTTSFSVPTTSTPV